MCALCFAVCLKVSEYAEDDDAEESRATLLSER